jgi:hypothetical protein
VTARRFICVVASILAMVIPARSHDVWTDGSPVPDWIKSSCCGKADAHHLTPEQVHDMGDYYRIDGMTNDIPKSFRGTPNSAILPSQDGDYWVFYKDTAEHDNYNQYNGSKYHEPASESVYFFFVPVAL